MSGTAHIKRAIRRTGDGGGLQPARFEIAEYRRARRRQLAQHSSLIVATMMTTMAGQRGHLLRILTVLGTELLARGGHA
jgi:hypothetical protein